MKKFLLIILVISLATLLLACEDKTKNLSGDKVDTVTETKIKETFVGTAEYKEPDFTDRTDFKVTKSEESNDIEYDSIFLHGMNSAQLDLKFKDGKVGSLMVSKFEMQIPSGEVATFSIADTEVSKYTGIDGFKHSVWTKSNSYYDFSSLEDFSDEELTKVIKGYSIEVGE